MNYLERNCLILREITQHLQANELLTDSQRSEMRRNRFVPIGSFYSHTLKATLFAGLKECIGLNPSQRAKEELAVIGIINHNLPHLAPELPQFYGVLIDNQGKEIGLVMEDFSQGDKFAVPDYAHVLKNMKGADNMQLPYEINDLFAGIGAAQLNHLAFLVDGQRKLGDFDKIFLKRGNIESGVKQLGLGLSYRQFLTYLKRIILYLDYECKV